MNLPAPFIALLALVSFSPMAFALGEPEYVEAASSRGSFAVVSDTAAGILIATNDWPGVIRAANDLATDIHRVTGRSPVILNHENAGAKNVVIIGTIGKSELIEHLARAKKIDLSEIAGKWESFFIQVVPKPFPGIDNALVICGSDKRGTTYGIYDVSEHIGVSPWHYWADVPVKHQDRLYVKPGKFVQGPPSVKYRGIFLNDEAPDLSGWIQFKFGSAPEWKGAANYGRGFYTNLFELMLRLRANYLWPAMWNNAFNEDDPENPRLADEYGIVMGTSHQEPMLRAQKEWDRSRQAAYGNWNYNNTNEQPVLQQFWREGIRRNKNFESIITLGLRAENDSGAPIGKDLTEQIVGVQRQILTEEMNSKQVPQLWCLYKEVQDFYNDGLRVPDDVTLLWAEDNWGNVRRLPSAEERNRSGGAGVYYHFDYHGGPRNYQWLNTSPIPKIWDQLSLAKQYGADRIWIVNVGHFKGSEFPIEFFMHLAWNTAKWTPDTLDDFTRLWAAREFGPEHANEIAHLLSAYTKFNGRRKPELLEPDTYSLVNYGEAEKVVADYQTLATEAEALNQKLSPESRDSFYELVLFPTKASAQLNAMYVAAAKNALYVRQGRASANDFAAETRDLFQSETNLMDYFNQKFAGGKWNHFMDQIFIGYTSWNEPRRNSLSAIPLKEIQSPEAAALGVAIEGSVSAWPDATNQPVLPPFDAFNQPSRYIEIFNHGQTAFDYSAEPSAPWIQLDSPKGTVEKDKRLRVKVDWSKAPRGTSDGEVKITGAGADVTVKITAFNPTEPTRRSLSGFVEADGCVSIEAEHYTAKFDSGANRWIKIPGYGHTLSAMRTDGPVDTQTTPRKDSPRLEYKMYLFTAGKVDVDATVGPTLNFIPGRGLRYAVSFDDEAPQTITIVPANFKAQNGNRPWEESVKNNGRHPQSTHVIEHTGYHTLKIWMIDPAVALEKVVVNTGGVRRSYLGPPESFHGASK